MNDKWRLGSKNYYEYENIAFIGFFIPPPLSVFYEAASCITPLFKTKSLTVRNKVVK